jgi:type I restriction enzyme S subunit
MTLDTFFEKFDLFADAPDAVGKMRELVLDWATTGQLGRTGSGEWKDCELGELIELISGQHLLASDYNAEQRGIPYLTGPSDFGDKHPIPTRWTERPKVTAEPGDILITVKGSGVGKTNVLIDQPTAISRQLMAIRVIAADPDFVHLVIKRAAEHFQNAKTGIAIPGIGRREVLGLKLVLPPLAEQKRIVAKVDELMALCDRLEAQQQERQTRHAALARASLARFADAPTPANLHFLFHSSFSIPPSALRKSILTLAVQGKLVPQDPSDGDSRGVIDRAMEKRQQTIKTKSLRRKELDESADLFEHEDLPSSWCVERFANLVDPENTISYGVLVPGNDVPDGIPFVRAQDLCLSNHPARPNKTIAPDIEKPYARTRLTGGEILLCVVGSIGKLGIVPDSWAGANIARAVARIKPIPDVLRDYLLLVLQEQSVQNYFTSTTRTLAQPTLNVGMIEQTPIPVPPLAEQRRIVVKVDQLMALVDELETQLAASRATAKNLLEALVVELTAAEPQLAVAS